MSAPKPTEHPARDSISKLTVSYVLIKDTFRKDEPRPEWSYRAGRRSTARVFYRQQKRPAVFGENQVEQRRREVSEAKQQEISAVLAEHLIQTKPTFNALIIPPQNVLNASEKPKRVRKPRIKKNAYTS